MRRLLRLSVSTVAALVLCAVTVEGQKAETVPAVQAEVEITYALANGREVRVRGHYYRSRDGRVREDNGRGSVIADVSKGTLTVLNTDTKQALVFTVSEPAPTKEKEPRVSPAVPFGHSRHEGRAVSKARIKDAGGKEQEVWTATDIGLTVFSRIESAGLTTTKELRNVVEAEPDPAVFTVPKDYTVEHHTLPSFESGAMPPPERRKVKEDQRKPGELR